MNKCNAQLFMYCNCTTILYCTSFIGMQMNFMALCNIFCAVDGTYICDQIVVQLLVECKICVSLDVEIEMI